MPQKNKYLSNQRTNKIQAIVNHIAQDNPDETQTIIQLNQIIKTVNNKPLLLLNLKPPLAQQVCDLMLPYHWLYFLPNEFCHYPLAFHPIQQCTTHQLIEAFNKAGKGRNHQRILAKTPDQDKPKVKQKLQLITQTIIPRYPIILQEIYQRGFKIHWQAQGYLYTTPKPGWP